MALFKCKMCGGALEINNHETVAICEYCGTQQTLPKLDNDRKVNLYDRANHFRRNNEFDKAMGIYEQILNEDNTDAEAYWSLVLCRYGIEYVEDPSSHKRIPTINRAQFTSVFDDDNYKSALQYADGYQRHIYEQEAKTINEIQKGILAISQKEDPFDVFICYKETDRNGRRTPDSVLANDLYHQLTQEGFKVFFARITLEDQLGSAYEPYIFAALNSAKVMVVLGTKPEFFNAAWVRNEWSRYLALIKQGQKKTLIPAYKDMDPYDLPEEFSHLQAQDMSKLGFMQDLIRGIKKIVQADETKIASVKENIESSGNTNIAPLLKRVFMFLEDGDFDSADEYCEKVLDIEPENAQAYLGKLMAELWVRKQENLRDCAEPFDGSNNYQKVMRFGSEELRAELMSCIEHINIRNEKARLVGIYARAQSTMSAARTEGEYKEAARLFELISDYEDSAALAEDCCDKAEAARKDAILAKAKSKATGEAISYYESAIKLLEPISGWKDADEQICVCKEKIEEIKAKAEAERMERKRQAEMIREQEEKIHKRKTWISIITVSIVCITIALFVISNAVHHNNKYNDAVVLMDEGNLDDAYKIFKELGRYKDSKDKVSEIRLIKAKEALKSVEAGDYIKFGTYEQDNKTSNGEEDIEWLVLEVKDGRALLISRYALDYRSYKIDRKDKNATWENFPLRKWLNEDFLNTAFSDDEKAEIFTTTVYPDKKSTGNEMQDKIFLLSSTGLWEYFSSMSERGCKATDYAVAQGAYVEESTGNCWWWLRTDRVGSIYTAYINEHGEALIDSIKVDGYAVRPAMWVEANS